MKLRSVLAAAAAVLVFSAAVAPAADAATRRRHSRHSMHSQRMARTMPARPRGGDAQNAEVDRLNAQSLQAARGGTSMAPAGGMSQ